MAMVEQLHSHECLTLFVLSAFNERTKAYKNAAFDILFDHEASQGQIFADCGCHNLVKQVVDVSMLNQFSERIFVNRI